MPPLPSTLDSETLQHIASIRRREKDLSDFQIPRLRKCAGPLSLQQTLATEIREDLEVLDKQVESLDLSVEDLRGERKRRELGAVVDDLRSNLANLRIDTRSALLESKRVIDAQKQSQRDQLLQSSAVKEKQNFNEKVTDDALMKANDDVTEALRRTIGLMQGELERSVLTTQMLDASTASLRSTTFSYDTMATLMDTSKHLIKALEKADWMDRFLIFFGLLFFVLVVLFILKQRIVDRGVRIAFWWTRFIPDFSEDAELLMMEKGYLSSAAAATSSVLSSGVSTALVAVATGAATAPAPVADASSATELSTVSDEILPDISEAPSVSSIPDVSTRTPPVHVQTSSSDVLHEEL